MSRKVFQGDQSGFYVTDREVAEIVNLAIELEKPILVEGEPGCGKTRLAAAIAAELGLGPVCKVNIKSTTQAADLLYRFDALRRFQDAQVPWKKKAQQVYPYLSLVLLGGAIHSSKRSVVLLDEIDKADIDFPNDLLDVLDDFAFDVADLPEDEIKGCVQSKGFGRRVESSSDSRPIVVITSNREKQLPEPFLRRCLYVELEFPKDPKLLTEIVRLNLSDEIEIDQAVLAAAVDRLQQIRTVAGEANAQKLPTTSELIDWVKILHWRGVKPKEIDADLPRYWQTLFKTRRDRQIYPAAVRGKKA